MPPWEKYKKAESEGPWNQYQAPSDIPQLPVSEPGSFQYKLAMAGATPAQTFKEYAGQSLKEMAIPSVTTAFGALTGGIPGAMAGSALGETANQALNVYGNQSVFPELNKPDLARVGTAGVLPGVLPAIGKAVSPLINVVKKTIEPFTESGLRNALSRYQRAGLNNDPELQQRVIDRISGIMANKNAQQGPGQTLPATRQTVGEMTADIPGATAIASHQRAISKLETGPSAAFQERYAQNVNARRAALEARDAITGPQRREALAQANVPGAQLPELQATINKNENAMADAIARRAQQTPQPELQDPNALRSAIELHGHTVPPKPLKSAAELAAAPHNEEIIQRSFGNIASANASKAALDKPILLQPILKQIETMQKVPGDRTSDVMNKSLDALKQKLQEHTNEYGIIDSRDLYGIRKKIGIFIGKASKESQDWDKKMTAGLERQLQKTFDQSIVDAGGTEWPKYLADYSARSKAVSDEIAALRAYEKAASRTNQSGAKQIHTGEKIPQLWSRPVSLINATIERLGVQPAEEKIGKIATQQYLNPEQFIASLMRGSSPSRSQALIQALIQQQAPYTAAAFSQTGSQ